ncbi:MAG: VWA domain-containing protein [Thermoanaerobaculales bacterium]|jgi:VWFA-related protein|nr:VWA domain-containing protein [Thermoanaerobaculales bacterium]
MRAGSTVLAVLVMMTAAAVMADDDPQKAAEEPVGGLAFADEVQVTVVNIDVYVRDRGGDPVTGLGPEDFRIFQNGVEMPVSNFAELNAEVIRHRVSEQAFRVPEKAAASSAEPEEELEIKPIFVVLFIDHENIETLDRNRVLRRVREFVTENLDEPVRMMVVSRTQSLKVLQPFTSESREVNGALRSMTMATGGREERETERQAIIKAMTDARNQDHGTTVNTQTGARMDMRQRVSTFAAEEAYSLRMTLDGLRQVIAMLSGIEGRKSIIYVSSGIPMEPGLGLMQDYAMTFGDQSILSLRGRYDGTRLFHELTSVATAQEVSLYSIDATGLNPLDGFEAESAYSRDPTASSLGSKNYQASLKYMAEATGGIAVVNTNDVSGGLMKITDDLYNYYSLGYPLSTSGQDRVHHIKVELTGDKKVDLRYRRRFVEKSFESRIQDRVFTSLVVDIDDDPMGLELTAEAPAAGSGEQWMIPFHVSFDLNTIALMPVGDELIGRVVLYVGARDEDGRSSEVQRQEHEIRLPKDDYLAAGKERFGLDFRLLLTEGRQRIAVGLMDPITRQAAYDRLVLGVP